MDTSARHATAIALLAVGCGVSAASHAYSKDEDAAAQDREVQAAYDRGYKAAREELAQQAAAAAPAAAAPRKAVGPATQKPILDFKNTYSDAGEVSTVMTVPVVVKPLASGQDAQAAAAAEAQSEAPADQQPVPRSHAQVPANHRSVAAAPPADDDVAPPESLAKDEAVDESESPRAAQQYSTESLHYAQPAQPEAQYAPPPVASRPPPQPYGSGQQAEYTQQQPAFGQQPVYPQQQSAYAQQPAYPQQYAQQQYAQQQPVYAQQPAYAPPRPAYYPPPAPYQPPPRTRWVYWSPQYGRWIYY